MGRQRRAAGGSLTFSVGLGRDLKRQGRQVKAVDARFGAAVRLVLVGLVAEVAVDLLQVLLRVWVWGEEVEPCQRWFAGKGEGSLLSRGKKSVSSRIGPLTLSILP